MPWNFRSNYSELKRANIDWAEMGRRRYWTRRSVAGWLEFLLFSVATVAVIGLLGHGYKHGDWITFGAGALIGLMGWWPLIRHRIVHGEWP